MVWTAPKTKAIFLAGFVALAGWLALVTTSGGLMLALVGYLAIVPLGMGTLWVWNRWVWPRSRRKLVAGDEACPRCASLQTDEVDGLDADGRALSFHQCFRCDHRWSSDGNHEDVALTLEPAQDRRPRN